MVGVAWREVGRVSRGQRVGVRPGSLMERAPGTLTPPALHVSSLLQREPPFALSLIHI